MPFDLLTYLFGDTSQDPCLTEKIAAARKKLADNPPATVEHGDGLMVRLANGDLVLLCAPAGADQNDVPVVDVYAHLSQRRDSRGRTLPAQDVRSVTDGRRK